MSDPFNWAVYTEAVLSDIFEAPHDETSRPPEDVRYGSVSVNCTNGLWFDSEHKLGGGLKDLIYLYKGIEDHDAAASYAKTCLQKFKNDRKASKNGNSQQPGSTEIGA